MPDMNTQTTPMKPIEKTMPGAPKKKPKDNFQVSFIVPREGPLF